MFLNRCPTYRTLGIYGLIEGSYINGVSSDLLFTVSPNVPPGYLIQVEPKQKVYVPIKNLSQIDSVRFSTKTKITTSWILIMNQLLTMFTFEKLYSLTINMLSQREVRFHKRKIIGGSFLKNVYDKVRKVISTGSKILDRVPTGVKSEIKKTVLNKIPKTALNDRSRAILSNLIAGSGFKN